MIYDMDIKQGNPLATLLLPSETWEGCVWECDWSQIVEKTPIHNHMDNCHFNQSKTCGGVLLSGRDSTRQRRRQRRHGVDPWVGKIPWRRKCQPTSVFLPGKSPGQRSLVGSSPWCCKELGITAQLSDWAHTHAHMWILQKMEALSVTAGEDKKSAGGI